jgi:hypothetical protein
MKRLHVVHIFVKILIINIFFYGCINFTISCTEMPDIQAQDEEQLRLEAEEAFANDVVYEHFGAATCPIDDFADEPKKIALKDFAIQVIKFVIRRSKEIEDGARWLIPPSRFTVDKTPFIERCCADVGTTVCAIGDTHGDSKAHDAIEKTLTEHNCSLHEPVVKWIFLGDYVDRGPNSIGTLHRLFILKNKHWDGVMLLQGNHETPKMHQTHPFCNDFYKPVIDRLGQKFYDAWLKPAFAFMPCAVAMHYRDPLLKDQYLFFTHGGFSKHFLHQDLAKINTLMKQDKQFCIVEQDICKVEYVCQPMFYGQPFPQRTEILYSGYQWADFCGCCERDHIHNEFTSGNRGPEIPLIPGCAATKFFEDKHNSKQSKDEQKPTLPFAMVVSHDHRRIADAGGSCAQFNWMDGWTLLETSEFIYGSKGMCYRDDCDDRLPLFSLLSSPALVNGARLGTLETPATEPPSASILAFDFFPGNVRIKPIKFGY